MKDELLSPKESEAIRVIRNAVIRQGRFPSVRDLMKSLEYKSPRSASVLIQTLVDKGIVRRGAKGGYQLIRSHGTDSAHAETIDVPLVGSAACGLPLLAEENIEAMIPVSTKLARPTDRYFMLRATGDSMNMAGINDGDLVLMRVQSVARSGERVVALIDDEATIKELQINRDTIVLKPKSTNLKHQPIVVTRDFQIQGVVVATIPT